MQLSLILLGIGHFFGLAVLFANTSMTDVIGEQIVKTGGLGQGLETVPLAFLVGATALVISPAGMIMNKFGYKNVFLAGAFLGMIGSLICVGALFTTSGTLSLVLYTIGLIPQGFAYGIVNYYRHVAALMGNIDEATKSWYIAIVISSGALGGVAGPALSAVSEYWLQNHPFVATCICIAAIELLHFVTLLFTSIQIDKPATTISNDAKFSPPRPLLTIITQPSYFCAFITGTTAHGLMILIMGITPLVLHQEINTDNFWYLAFVIQGHVLCMYIPSFFTSKLIAKFSAIYVALFGVVVTGIGAALYLIDDGNAWHHYYFVLVSMAVIGIGWNFSFVCATTMITGTYSLQEKFKAQAFNDTWLFGLGSILTLLSGVLYNAEGGFKYIIIGCVITYTFVAILNTFYIVWKCQKTAKVDSVESKEISPRISYDSLKEETENVKWYEIKKTVEGAGERPNYCPNYDDVQPNQRKRMQSMSLADLHFHSKDAEKQFFIHTMNKLSADCISLVTSDQFDVLVCQDPNKGDTFKLAVSNALAECKFMNTNVSHHEIIQNEQLYGAVVVNMPLIKGYLVLLFENTKTKETVEESLKWMDENGKFVESLLSVLTKLNSSQDVAEESPKVHSGIECANTNQQKTLEDLTVLFEKELLKRMVKRKADDFWDEFGRSEFQKRLWYYIEHDDPILFVLPAFPFKSCNQRTKVLGILPDMGEKLALQRLEKFLLSIETVYPPGAYLVMFSDGRVYCDQFRISDEITSKFKIQIRRTYPCEVIYWSDLDMFFPSFNDDEKRVALVNLFGTTPEDVDAEIRKDVDFREVYCGFKKFMKEELTIPKELGNRKGRQVITGVAKNLMMRNYSYGHFMKILFPNHVRLSIHPSQCIQKFSVNLVGETDWGTPWHNCALLQPDGTWSLIRRKTAEEKGYTLTASDDGLPYYINDSGEIFKENL